MRIGDLMTRDVAACQRDQPLDEAIQIMVERDCGCVPVVDEGGRPIGIVTDRDACLGACRLDCRLSELTVGDVMTPGVTCCRPEQSAADAEAIMREAQVRRLAVVDEGRRLCGVVSLGDLARETPRQGDDGLSEREIGEALATICRGPAQRPAALAR